MGAIHRANPARFAPQRDAHIRAKAALEAAKTADTEMAVQRTALGEALRILIGAGVTDERAERTIRVGIEARFGQAARRVQEAEQEEAATWSGLLKVLERAEREQQHQQSA